MERGALDPKPGFAAVAATNAAIIAFAEQGVMPGIKQPQFARFL
jgi:hypothetical protein